MHNLKQKYLYRYFTFYHWTMFSFLLYSAHLHCCTILVLHKYLFCLFPAPILSFCLLLLIMASNHSRILQRALNTSQWTAENEAVSYLIINIPKLIWSRALSTEQSLAPLLGYPCPIHLSTLSSKQGGCKAYSYCSQWLASSWTCEAGTDHQYRYCSAKWFVTVRIGIYM